MKLKAILSQKSDVEALHADLRSAYTQQADGSYVLDVDGMTLNSDVDQLNTKLAEFRDNNRKLFGDLKKFEGVDPDKYRTLETELAALKKTGVNNPNDLQAAIQQAVSAAVQPLQARLDQTEAAKKASDDKLSAREFEDAVWTVGAKAGVEEWAKPFYVQKVRDAFKRDEHGTLIAERNGQPIYSKRRNAVTQPLTLDEYTVEWLPTEAPGFFKQNAGGGEKPRQTGGNGGNGTRVVGLDAFGSNLEAIAKGDVTVVGAQAR